MPLSLPPDALAMVLGYLGVMETVRMTRCGMGVLKLLQDVSIDLEVYPGTQGRVISLMSEGFPLQCLSVIPGTSTMLWRATPPNQKRWLWLMTRACRLCDVEKIVFLLMSQEALVPKAVSEEMLIDLHEIISALNGSLLRKFVSVLACNKVAMKLGCRIVKQVMTAKHYDFLQQLLFQCPEPRVYLLYHAVRLKDRECVRLVLSYFNMLIEDLHFDVRRLVLDLGLSAREMARARSHVLFLEDFLYFVASRAPPEGWSHMQVEEVDMIEDASVDASDVENFDEFLFLLQHV